MKDLNYNSVSEQDINWEEFKEELLSASDWQKEYANKEKAKLQEEYPDEELSGPISQNLSDFKLSGHNLNTEVDLYIAIYRYIITEAFENGDYEIRNNGKTYSGKKAIEDFLIEEYGFDDAEKIRAYENQQNN